MSSGMKVTVVSPYQGTRASFYEHFYKFENEKMVILEKSWASMDNKDVLVIPCDNAWGIPNKITTDIVNAIGSKLEVEVKNYIDTVYCGEQPKGSCFLLPWRGVKGTPKSPRWICWACMSRVPNDLQKDFCYSTVWSAFSQINIFNRQIKLAEKQSLEQKLSEKDRKKKKITEKERNAQNDREKPLKTVVIPEFVDFLDKPDDTLTNELSRQMAMALECWLNYAPQQIVDLRAAERRHNEIITPVVLTRKEIEANVWALLFTREIETRGLCSIDELSILIDWVNDHGPEAETAARALCYLIRRPEFEYGLSSPIISERIVLKGGCLSELVKMGTTGQLIVHNEIARKDIEFGDKIGTGNAGVVYKATWKNIPVAVKTFSITLTELEYKEFIKEVVMLSLVKSPYIVACYGASTKEGDKFIVEELMKTSLYDLLHDTNFELTNNLRIDFAYQIATCMSFFHNCGLIHRDLKSLNILVNNSLILKLCDFGLARIIDRNTAMTANIGTVSWIAPEVFAKKNYSEKADVYSFGIIMWELVTRLMPFGEVEPFAVPLKVTKGDRPVIPKECPKEYSRLIVLAWNQKPGKRPGFDYLERKLKRMKMDWSGESKRLGFKPEEESLKTKAIQEEPESQSESHSQSHCGTTSTTTDITADDDSDSRNYTNSGISSGGNSEKDSGNAAKISVERKHSRKSNHGKITKLVPIQYSALPIIQSPSYLQSLLTKCEHETKIFFTDLTQNYTTGTITSSLKRQFIILNPESISGQLYHFIKTYMPCSQKLFYKITSYFGKIIGLCFGAIDVENVMGIVGGNLSEIEKVLVLPVWLSYKGWCSTVILENSNLVLDKENFVLFWEQPYSFEANTWVEKSKVLSHTACHIITGAYTSWLSHVLGFPISVVECLCTARGDPKCVFTAAAPHKIAEFIRNLKNYLETKKIVQVEFLDRVKAAPPEPLSANSWIIKLIDETVKEKLKVAFNEEDPSNLSFKELKKKRRSLNLELRKKLVRTPSQPKNSSAINKDGVNTYKPTKKIKITTGEHIPEVFIKEPPEDSQKPSLLKRNSMKTEKSLLKLKSTISVPATLSMGVETYFYKIELCPNSGKIRIEDKNYILLSNDNLGKKFYEKLQYYFAESQGQKSLSGSSGGSTEQENKNNILLNDFPVHFAFDLGRCMGQSAFNEICTFLSSTKDSKKLKLGFLPNMCYTGWGNGDLFSLVGTSPKYQKDPFMIGFRLYDNVEPDNERTNSTDFPYTVSMGYILGWCESNYNQPLSIVQVDEGRLEDDNKTFYRDILISTIAYIENYVAYAIQFGINSSFKISLSQPVQPVKLPEKSGLSYWLQKLIVHQLNIT